MIIIIYSRARYIKTALETKKDFTTTTPMFCCCYLANLFIIFREEIVVLENTFLLKEKHNDGKTPLVYYFTMIHKIII